MTMDTSKDKATQVILKDGTVFKFKVCGSRLYYYDMAITDDHNSAKTNTKITPYSLLSNVTENEEFYMNSDIEGVGRGVVTATNEKIIYVSTC